MLNSGSKLFVYVAHVKIHKMEKSPKFVHKLTCSDFLTNYDRTTGCGDCKTCGKRVNWSTKRIISHKNSKNCNDTTFMSNLQSLESAETSSSSAASVEPPQPPTTHQIDLTLSNTVAVLGNFSQIRLYDHFSRIRIDL